MEFRNIHIASATTAEPHISAPATPAPAADVTLKIRRVKVSPAEEYRLRSGNPRPISMALAAMILSKSGKVEITSKGVRIDRADIGKRSYWHSDSRLCNDLSHRNRKVIYVLNTLQPEIIHLLDESGRYLESLPQVEGVTPFDQEATEKAHAQKNRQISRITQHMQRIHQPDSDEALEAKSRVASEMQRVVSVLPTPATSQAPEAPSTLGDTIAAASRNGAHQTYRDLPATTAPAHGRTSRQTTLPTSRHTAPTAADLLLAKGKHDDDIF